MGLLLKLSFFVVLATIFTGSTFGTKYIQSRVPNGYLVPHPCNLEYIWREIGYQNHHGSGPMNQFGVDFEANYMTWDRTICMMDSDGDGRTNGAELGDPDCKWTPGAQPERTTGLSHPGVCEPLNSVTCRGKSSFVNCEDLCSGLSEIGVTRHRVTMTSAVSVPSKGTAYKCMVFDFPPENDYHIVSLAPHIDNPDLLEHIIVFGCDGDAPEDPDDIYTCYMNVPCRTQLFHWTRGDSDICLNPEVGVRVGNDTTAFKRGVIQLNLKNPHDATANTMSGVDLFITPTRRRYDAGVLFWGQKYLNIPPSEEDHVVSGGCSSSCTRAKMSGPIQVIAAYNHMHLHGVAGMSGWVVNESRVHYLANDQPFSFDYPKYHSYQDEPLQINPGDRLHMVCHFNTSSQHRTMNFGPGKHDAEMCYGFAMFYPKENVALPVCDSYGDLDTCDLEKDVIRGCDVASLDFRNPDTVPEFSVVKEYCNADTCRKECMTLVKRLKRHPCYSGSLRNYLMSKLETTTNQLEKINMQSFWLKMRSCDYELGAEMTSDMTGAATKPLSQSAVPISIILLLVLANV